MTWQNARTGKAEKDQLSDNFNGVKKQNEELQKELYGASQPIKDLKVSFEATVPMEHPLLNSYKNRLDAGMAEFRRDFKLFRPLPKYDIRFWGLEDEVAQIGQTSPLLPQHGKEEEAFMLLNAICLTAFFNKNPLTIEQITMLEGPPDFEFTICPEIARSEDIPDYVRNYSVTATDRAVQSSIIRSA